MARNIVSFDRKHSNISVAAFHTGLDLMKSYLSNLKVPEAEFQPSKLLQIMDSFSQPLHVHLEAEPQAILALSRYASPPHSKSFDLVAIEREQGKKALTLDFALNVLPIFMNNMETEEFEDGIWKKHPIDGWAGWIMKTLIPMWKTKQWRFLSCSADGKRKRLVA
jgi:hypothetical protein